MTSSNSPQFLPFRKPDAGSLVGVSYIAEFIKCPRRWYNRYARPTIPPDGNLEATGIEAHHTAQPLITGGLFHTAIESYYRSGVVDGADTGDYSIDKAISDLETRFKERQTEYETSETAETDFNLIRHMLLTYDERFGPNSPSPDWPRIKVVCDPNTGEPLIEREFITPLDYQNYFLTSKIDLIVEEEGFTKAMEHKTSVATFVGQRISSIHTDAQFAGEILTINKNIETGSPLAGVKVNVIIKNRSPNSKFDIAVRDSTNRTPSQLADFAAACVDTLQQIDERKEAMDDWVSNKGVDPEQAASVWFPSRGQFNGECQAYRRQCDFALLCKQPERAKNILTNFRPRVRVESDTQDNNHE